MKIICQPNPRKSYTQEQRQLKRKSLQQFLKKDTKLATTVSKMLGTYRNELQRIRRHENPHLARSYAAKRRGIKLKATPCWLTKFDLNYIKSIYLQAAELSKIENIVYHVDHIVPLNSNKVCGLHVPWNLQILEATANMIKSNKF